MVERCNTCLNTEISRAFFDEASGYFTGEFLSLMNMMTNILF